MQSSQIWTTILFYGTAQGLLLLVALLLGRRGRRLSNVLMATMLFWSVIHVANSFLVSVGLHVQAPWMLYVTAFVSPSIGPLYFFYTRSLLAPEYRPNVYIAAVVLILPGALWLARMISVPFGLEERAAWLVEMRNGTPEPLRMRDLVVGALAAGYLLVFLSLTWRYIRKKRLELRKYFARRAGRYVIWLGILGGGLLAYAVVLLSSLVHMATTLEYSITDLYLWSLMRCLVIQFTALSVFFLPEAFTTAMKDLAIVQRRMPLDDQTANRYVERLQKHMETSKSYRNEDLRLNDLAIELSMTAHVLSQLVNNHLDTSFSDFINGYRVEDAKRRMLEPENDNFTLVALAKDAGFNSKSSFYRAFKKYTGMSPSEYRSQVRQPG